LMDSYGPMKPQAGVTRVLLLYAYICCMHIRPARQLTGRWDTAHAEETDRPATSVTARAHLAKPSFLDPGVKLSRRLLSRNPAPLTKVPAASRQPGPATEPRRPPASAPCSLHAYPPPGSRFQISEY
jgi:hypothetical protein